MNAMSRILAAVGLVLITGSQSVVCEGNQDRLKSELQELIDKMDRAMVDGKTEEVLAFYADDAVILPNNAPKIVGKVELRKRMQEHGKSGVSFGSFEGRVEQAWECGGMVYLLATYALSANVPGIARPVGDRGKSIAIFRRVSDGKLQIIYDIWNTDIEYGK